MIIRDLISLDRIDREHDGESGYGSRNVVVQVRSSEILLPERQGPLSIRCAFGGTETYVAGNVRHLLNDRSYLILNAGQRYSSQISSPTEVEHFCVYFRPGLIGEVLRGVTQGVDAMLDSPDEIDSNRLDFVEKLYRHDTTVSPLLYQLRSEVSRYSVDSLWLEEKCHGLMEAMVQVYHTVQAEVDRLPMVRRSARLELYRRLSNARDFIDANLDRSVALKEMADIACLSTHYFLRRFEQAFQETPHQYLIRKRISRAKELLLTTNHSITDISSRTGFPSLSAFSWLFRQRTGVSPALYRTMQGPSA